MRSFTHLAVALGVSMAIGCAATTEPEPTEEPTPTEGKAPEPREQKSAQPPAVVDGTVSPQRQRDGVCMWMTCFPPYGGNSYPCWVCM